MIIEMIDKRMLTITKPNAEASMILKNLSYIIVRNSLLIGAKVKKESIINQFNQDTFLLPFYLQILHLPVVGFFTYICKLKTPKNLR